MSDDAQIELWRLKKQIQRIEATQTNNTSVVSLICPGTEEVSRMYQMLNQEATQADCIKSRVNRQAVQTAITLAANRVKLYLAGRMPKNGLCVFAGEVYENQKIQKVAVHFTPCRPITNFLYSCDGHFHTEEIKSLLTMDQTYGFVIMDGHGSLYATLCGNFRVLLQRFMVDLPKKHGRGGQSAVRFARLRLEARHNYVHIVAEHLVKHFIDPATSTPNVAGLIFAGSADFKEVLAGSDLLDDRLKKIILKQVDIAYGQEPGLAEAIEKSQDVLKDVKLVKEVQCIKEFMDNISRDTQKVCFGLLDTLRCIQQGSVETLILWEEFPWERVVFHNNSGEEYVKMINEKTNQVVVIDHDNFDGEEEISRELFSEYIIEKKKELAIDVQLITDASSEGTQFCQGFGGLGAILRFQVDVNEIGKFMNIKGDEVYANQDDFDGLEDFI